ncbi:MAG TPA: response regulator transcription factor [Bryobacteraceae bacterium]|jgi:DNA-binding NarL/FixJ family response regulator|nr:response regulator transcription factor [Bryobacteraceae bacterium]
MIRVVLADDHSIVRKGLRAVLEEEAGIEVAAEASNGRDAVRACEEVRPNVAVVDIAMPQLNGIEAAVQIRKVSPSTAVIMLSMYSDETYIMRALTAGAKGYLLKDTAEEDVLPAIHAAVQGKSYFSPAIAKTLLEDYVRYLRQRKLEDTYDLLTEREREVLQLLAEGKSNKEAAGVLNLSLSTIETHRTNLMQKLNLHSTAEIVLYAVRKKIICAPE